jgi:hypothetical protein
MVHLFFYVPEQALETVKQAVFEAGAGEIGDYSQCCWQIKGQGQFRPSAGSQPFLGKQDELTKVAEYRVEVVMEKACVKEVKSALLASHPYEEVAYGFVELLDV